LSIPDALAFAAQAVQQGDLALAQFLAAQEAAAQAFINTKI
jgi:1-deoxy-D-xylulose 5-phosphate reductoisomerase